MLTKSERMIELNKERSIHGLYKTRAYLSYIHMINRCTDEETPCYSYYGGRGIKICERWLLEGGQGVINFFKDMGEREEDQSLDRIDPEGDYTPENCRWADKSTQSYNKRKYSTNKTGKTGVKTHSDGRFMSSINVNKKRKHLVYTDDLELAIFCREEAEMHYFGKLKGN